MIKIKIKDIGERFKVKCSLPKMSLGEILILVNTVKELEERALQELTDEEIAEYKKEKKEMTKKIKSEMEI